MPKQIRRLMKRSERTSAESRVIWRTSFGYFPISWFLDTS